MNLQEFRALVSMLQENAGSLGQSQLEKLACQTEDAILNATGVLDPAVIQDFRAAKKTDNHYSISSAEPTMIQNAKAMINLLRSLDKIPVETIATLVQASTSLTEAFLNSETDFTLSSLAQIVGMKASDILVAAGDFAIDPAKHINSVAGTLWANRSEVAASVVPAATNAFHHIRGGVGQIGPAVASVWNNKAGIMSAVKNPKTAIAAAVANAGEQYFGELNRDFKVYKHYLGELVGTVQALSHSADPAVTQMKKLSTILVDNDLFKMHSTFTSGVRRLTEGTRIEADTLSGQFHAKARGVINPLKSEITELTSPQQRILATLKKINMIAHSKLGELNAYQVGFNQGTNLYEIDDKHHLTHEQKQLMKIANISNQMSALADRIMRAQNEGVKFRDLAGLEEYMSNMGVIWKELQGLDPKILSGSFASKGLSQMYETLVAPVKEMIIVTLETEIKLGLSKDILLPNLENISTLMNQFARANNLQTVSGYPFAEERKMALARNIIDIQDKQKKAKEAGEYVRGNPLKEPGPYLIQIIHLIDKLKSIPTLSAKEYSAHLVELKNEITGLKKLEDEIKKVESEIYTMDEKRNQAGPNSPASGELAAKLKAAKSLYVRRDKLMASLNKVEEWKDNYAYRNNKYYQGDDAVFVSESISSASMAAANKVGAKFAEDVINTIADYSHASDRMAAQINALGGNVADVISTVKSKMELPTQDLSDGATQDNKHKYTPDQKQMDRIDKVVKKREEAEYDKSLSDDIATIDRVGTSQYTEILRVEITAGIRQKYGGDKIDYFKDKSRVFLGQMRSLLNDKQRDLLSESKKNQSGDFTPDANDTALVRNIKNVSNVMNKFDHLMELYVKFQAISSAGYANKELLTLLAPLRDNINSLVSDIKTVANDLRVLGAMANNTIGEAATSHLQAMLPLIDQIPVIVSMASQQLGGLSSAFDINSMASIDEVPKQNLVKAVELTKSIADGVDMSSEIDFDIKSLLGNAATKLYQNTSKAAYSLLEQAGIHLGLKGTYDLKKIKPDTLEFGIALLHNQSITMKKALDACADVSGGRKVAGKIQLYGAAISAFLDYVKNYEKVMKETLTKYKNVTGEVRDRLMTEFNTLKPELSKLLDRMQPILKNFISQAEMVELTMGLKNGVLSETFSAKLQSLVAVISNYGSPQGNANPNTVKPTEIDQRTLVKSQLAMLRKLKEDPTQNTGLIDSQIKQTESVLKTLENRVKLRTAGVATTNLGKHGAEAARRQNESRNYGKNRYETKIIAKSEATATPVSSKQNSQFSKPPVEEKEEPAPTSQRRSRT